MMLSEFTLVLSIVGGTLGSISIIIVGIKLRNFSTITEKQKETVTDLSKKVKKIEGMIQKGPMD